ncbi:MAG: hypothetical protein EOO99_01430 [Pedobacter sp.]|nr:MAG: hypothetical protein EOO99_01430 [Pedobacter sp.]
MALNEQNTNHLYKLLANPALACADDLPLLDELVQAYPYFQPLHLLRYEAAKKLENAAEYLTRASLHNGGDLCFRLMYAPETLISSFSTPAAFTDDQEVFDEIEDIAPSISITSAEINETEETFEEIADLAPSVSFTSPEEINNELIFEEIEDVSIGSPILENPPLIAENPLPTEKTTTEPVSDDHRVSKYDDDQLPYTFLWWLAKTRKEHEQIFQPYVSQKKPEKPAGGELQHQIIEHIFHLQTPFDLEEELQGINTPQVGLTKKDEIIDKFIKNDPQIKAPKPEQINTENKAKRSAEDQDDLVSETLASIYIEQMLYHKAIETYEKLSLKFPEKSRYFADLIQSLEKKI